MPTAVAYYRTSSAANVGADKDSERRQREAVLGYAKGHGYTVVREFYDAAVSGADPIDTRPGFAELLQYLAGNGARTIIVESASRFARDLAVQLTGHELLRERGIELICADAPTYFIDPSPTAEMVRSILGAVSQFEKASLVNKLRVARERKRTVTGRCEGRKPLGDTAPEAVQLALQLHGGPRRKRRPSLRQISILLAEAGHVNSRRRPYDPRQIARMIKKK